MTKVVILGVVGPQLKVKNGIFYDLLHKSNGNEMSKNDKNYHFC